MYQTIHMIRADIETEVSPIVGSEKQSEEMIHYLLQEFEGDTAKIWQSNIFPRVGGGGPERQGEADARGRPGEAAGDPPADHQRGLRGAHLHHFIGRDWIGKTRRALG